MKKYNYVSALLLLPALCAPAVQAADNTVTGFVMPTATGVHIHGNKAKASEYGDSDSSLSGSAEVKASGNAGFVNFNADDVLQDTQSYKAEVGQYGKVKLDLFYNEIPHNNTFDANTIQSGGVGTNQLTSPLNSVVVATPAPDPATAGSFFDYAITRDQYGAGLRLDLLKPFFANFSVSREDREGLRPIGSSYQMELPEPVDYKTNMLQAEVGYGKDPFFVSLGYTRSKFDNAYDTLYYTNIYTTTAMEDNFVSLPPDNDYSKLDLKGRVKLPLRSALALAYSKAKAESQADMYTTYKAGTGTPSPTAARIHPVTLSDTVFDGRVDSTNYSAALTTNPVEMIDGKIFFRKYATSNKSDAISIQDTAETNQDYSNVLFDYSKKSYGLEVGVNLPGHVTLSPSYGEVETKLADGVVLDDQIIGIAAKWKGADLLAAHIGYERMDRDDNYDSDDTGSVVGAPVTASAVLLAPYTRMYDITAQKRDIYRLGLDVFPTEKLDLGFAYKHKKIDYNETAIGLTGERGDTFAVSVNFAPLSMVSISAYADYEKSKLEKLQRRGTVTTAAQANPVDTNPADAFYNVTTTLEDKNVDWGLGVNVTAIPKKLTLSAQYDHTRSNGHADFTYDNNSGTNNSIPVGWTNDTIDYSNWDDYKKDSLQIKATFSLSASLDLLGGYAYEYYRYTDGQYDNYQYLYQSSATAVGYLSGANANPDYTANVVWMSAKYKF